MDMDTQHVLGHAECTGTSSTDVNMQLGQTCSFDMNLDMQHVLAHIHEAWKWTFSMSQTLLLV
jgi:hypothetical protein